MKFSPILPAPAEPYLPPSFDDFKVVSPINLPEGGLDGFPEENSVIEVLASSENPREYYLLNVGTSKVRLFFGGDVARWQSYPMTPFILTPGLLCNSDLSTCMLSVYAWSEGDIGELVLGVFENSKNS